MYYCTAVGRLEFAELDRLKAAFPILTGARAELQQWH